MPALISYRAFRRTKPANHGGGIATTVMKSLFATLLASLLIWSNPEPPSLTPPPPPPIEEDNARLALFADEMAASVQALLWVNFPSPGHEDVNISVGPEDSAYVLPSLQEFEQMIQFWKKYRQGMRYMENAWDCEDFAREFHSLAHAWGRRHYLGFPASVAVGTAMVHLRGDYPLFPGARDVEAYHVINVILLDNGQWLFFEPQTGMFCPIEAPVYEGVIRVMKITI